MKKFAKLLALVMVMALVMSTLTACGAIDKKKVVGDWSIATLNGKSVEDYAASVGADVNMCKGGLTITENKISVVNAVASTDFDKYDCLADGIQVEANGAVVLALQYDEKADTLTQNQATADGSVLTVVFKRGTVSFEQPVADEEAAGEEEYYEEEE